MSCLSCDKDIDIVPIKTNVNVVHSELIPVNEPYLYLKITENVIYFAKGTLLQSMFKLKKINGKKLREVDSPFFKEYLYTLYSESKKTNSAYQFKFQHNGEKEYICSIYPCKIWEDVIGSFDVIVRESKETEGSFIQKFARVNRI